MIESGGVLELGRASPVATTLLRVLIVDDNADAASMMAQLTMQWGHTVLIAHSSVEAMRVAAEFKPRVVLLDLGLPDVHGYELAEALRAQAGATPLHFVAVTGWSHIADQIRSGAVGITHHLIKPVNHDVLREILARYASEERRREA